MEYYNNLNNFKVDDIVCIEGDSIFPTLVKLPIGFLNHDGMHFDAEKIVYKDTDNKCYQYAPGNGCGMLSTERVRKATKQEIDIYNKLTHDVWQIEY